VRLTGYQTFSAGIGANNTTYYTIADQGGANWEVGYGTIGAGGTTLARTTVLASSNSGSLGIVRQLGHKMYSVTILQERLLLLIPQTHCELMVKRM